MTETAWIPLLATQTLLFSAAVLLLALLRPLLRRLLDAGAVYLAWLLVPLMMLSPALPRLLQGQVLPAPVQTLEQAVPAWLRTPPVTAVQASAPRSAGAQPRADAALGRPASQALALALAGWGLGALALLALLAQRQRRFNDRLLRQADAWRAPAGESPALMGLWHGRLVLPQDFETRFSAREQALILAHEAVHARRHDNAWNLLAAGLLVLQWFNPLAWWALRAMRLDQELACDAAVLNQAHPHTPGEEPLVKTYVNALLKSHPQRALPVLSTGWAHRHPLLERVKGLRLHRRPAWQRMLGRGGAIGLCLGLTVLARAAQPLSGSDVTDRLMQYLAQEEAVAGATVTAVVVQLDSQQGQQAWQHKELATVYAQSALSTYSQFRLIAPMGDWCLGVHLYRFPDGDHRPQVEIMDKHCVKTLTQLQPMQTGSEATSLVARLPDEAGQSVQAQVSVRFADPRSDAFIALFKRQMEELPPTERLRMASDIAERGQALADYQAQDKAWRLARGAKP